MMATVRRTPSYNESDDIIEVPSTQRLAAVRNGEETHDDKGSRGPSSPLLRKVPSEGEARQVNIAGAVQSRGSQERDQNERVGQGEHQSRSQGEHIGGMSVLMRSFPRKRPDASRQGDGNATRGQGVNGSPGLGREPREEAESKEKDGGASGAPQDVEFVDLCTPEEQATPGKDGEEERKEDVSEGGEEDGRKGKKARGPSSPTNAVAMRSVNSIHKQGRPEETRISKRSTSQARKAYVSITEAGKGQGVSERMRSSSPDSSGGKKRGRSSSSDRRARQQKPTRQGLRADARAVNLVAQGRQQQGEAANEARRYAEKRRPGTRRREGSSDSGDDSDGTLKVEAERGADLFPEEGEELVDWERFGEAIAAFDWRLVCEPPPGVSEDEQDVGDEDQGESESDREAGVGAPGQDDGMPAGPRTLEEWALQAVALVKVKVMQPAAQHPGFVGDGEGDPSNCIECGGGEDKTMLLCDRCDNACHVRCLPKNAPPLARLAGKDWECTPCRKSQEEMGSAVLVGATWRGADAPWRVALQKAEQGRVQRRDSPDSVLPAGEKERERCPRRWMRGEWDAAGTIRIGGMFQAEVPEFQGPRETPLPSREEMEANDGTPFGHEVRVSQEELERVKAEEHQNCAKRVSGVRPNKLFESMAGEKWVQCRKVITFEGERKPNGRKSKKNVECGKWRRIPADVKVDLSKFDCSWALPFDPHYADCATPQVFDSREISRRRSRSKKRQQNTDKDDC